MLMLLLKINCLMKYVVTLIIKMSLNFGNHGMLNSVKMSIRMLMPYIGGLRYKIGLQCKYAKITNNRNNSV